MLMCGVHNITEILNILSSIDSNYLLKFHLACFSCFRTAQTTANDRHVFRVDKLPDRPPRFHIPRHFLPKVQSISPENFISVFLAEIQSLVTRQFWRECQRVIICRRDGLAKLYFTGKFEGPRSSNVQVMSKAKSPQKKDKKDHRNFFIIIIS